MRIFGALDAFAGSSRPGVRNRGAGGRAPSDLSGEASSPLSGLPAAPGGLGLPPAGAAPPPPPLRLRVAAVPARLRVRAVPRVRVRLRPSVCLRVCLLLTRTRLTPVQGSLHLGTTSS